MFISENVRGLVERHSETFAEILFLPTALQCYEIKWGILSPHTHGNVPQHRERVFITGILQEKMVRPFMWPQQVPLTNYVINDFIQPDVDDGLRDMVRWPQQKTLKRNLTKSIEKVIMDWGENPLQSHFVANIGCGPSRQPSVMKGICPCLTVARAGSYGYWLTWKNRFLRTDKIVMLMGVNPADLPPAVVSDRTLRQVAGNAMVVPVLSRLIRSMLRAVDLWRLSSGKKKTSIWAQKDSKHLSKSYHRPCLLFLWYCFILRFFSRTHLRCTCGCLFWFDKAFLRTRCCCPADYVDF